MTINHTKVSIVEANENDVFLILSLIKELADYEKLSHEVVTTEELLKETLFGSRKIAEVLLAYYGKDLAGFAVFFHNFSTFLGRPGIYIEDLYVLPQYRSKGIGTKLLKHIARLAVERNCGRVEWSVLDWNKPAIEFYNNLGAEHKEEWLLYKITGSALKALAD